MAGRPHKKAAERKQEMVMIRLTTQDKELLEKAANRDQRALADWARIQLLKAAGQSPAKP